MERIYKVNREVTINNDGIIESETLIKELWNGSSLSWDVEYYSNSNNIGENTHCQMWLESTEGKVLWLLK